MTAKNPLLLFRKQIGEYRRTAYYIKKLRSRSEITDFIYERLKEGFVPQLKDLAIRAWIEQMIGTSAGPDTANEDQLNLFLDYDEIFYAIRTDGKAGQIALGDVDKTTFPAIRNSRKANIESAQKALAELEKAWARVEPVLDDNPGWKWRDASKWLQERERVAAE